MSDEVFLEGKTYVSSKKAAATSGYAQDYIGQLARSGAIDVQRVGGLWYVSMDSLASYQRDAASYTPAQPPKSAHELDTAVSFDGKEYLSAARAAKLSGYHQDYVGQLARSGKLLSRQIGNRWYVEKQALLSHKAEKDRLLGAVQAEAVGIPRAQEPSAPSPQPLLTYFPEQKHLIPPLKTRPAASSTASAVPIRRMTAPVPVVRHAAQMKRSVVPKRSGSTISRAAEFALALTFVLTLSYGLFSLKNHSVYTVQLRSGASVVRSMALTASAGATLNALMDSIEAMVSKELVYSRK